MLSRDLNLDSQTVHGQRLGNHGMNNAILQVHTSADAEPGIEQEAVQLGERPSTCRQLPS